ncbi:MAG: HpaII family restriction endonuclease, partial [Clostridiales bacterium]|nr:HpaII family restriction endonuclease [Clostridiales bacterium]
IMNEINQIETRTKIIDKINRLIEFGCELKPAEHLESARFEENLQFIDTMMPRLLSLAVLYSYIYKLRTSKQIIDKMKELNPLGYSNVQMYEYKYKKMLCACALGMTPEKDWEGDEDANGGYIVVKRDGTVVCYHIYNRTDFEQYLFDYTCFDKASTSRYKYMDIYKDNEGYKIKLNLQVRFT